MRIAALAAAAIIATVQQASSDTVAGADPLASRFENTVVVRGADKSESKIYYGKDGTLSVTRPDGTVRAAKWDVKGGAFCVTVAGGQALCEAMLQQQPEAVVLTALVDSDREKAGLRVFAERNAGDPGTGATPMAAQAPKNVGDTWMQALPDGSQVSVAILPGRKS